MSVLALIGTVVITTGCANVHEFINGDFMTTAVPNTSNAIKSVFYSDRYQYNVPPDKVVPNEFANTAGDYWGKYKFLGFGSDNQKRQYWAYYYDPNFTKDGHLVTLDTAYFTRYPQNAGADKKFFSKRVVYQFNCSNETFARMSDQAYSGKNLDGTLVTDKINVVKYMKFHPVQAEGIDRMMYSKVCG